MACQVASKLSTMQTHEIQSYLGSVVVTEFAQRHKLPLRTLMRIKAGGTPTSANAKVIGDAIKKQKRIDKAKCGY